jgi:UDP-N-acetylmuramoyl-L-alanyl-D-glutamate--2,6-diaminopimelate ligase
MDAYLAAKARLFTAPLARHAVVPVDAPGAEALLARVAVPVTTVGPGPDANVVVRRRTSGPDGSTALVVLDGEELEVRTVMRGPHNLDNVLVALVTAVRAGIESTVARDALATVPAPPGRLEPFGGGADPLVLVDYAHTPDAVARIAELGRTLVVAGAALHVVLGAGGDRDRDKRGPMGRAAADAADRVVVTDDNPRSEEPATIRAAVAAGARTGPAEVTEVEGRASAIEGAVLAARPGDVVLVLGRGHEAEQELADGRIPLDDRDLVRAALRRRTEVRA